MADIRSKKPKVLGARVAGLRLTQEERFVMARIDGAHSVADLAGLTGLAPERLEQIVTKLAFDGAVDLGEDRAPPPLDLDEGQTSMADFAAVLGLDPNAFVDRPAASPESRRRPRIQKRHRPELPSSSAKATPEPAEEPQLEAVHDDGPQLEAVHDEGPQLEEVHDEGPQLEEVHDEGPQLEEVHDDGPQLEEVHGELEEVHDESDREPSAADLKEEELTRAVAERNYREVFEKRWHALPVDARVSGAKIAKGADLLALSFDPDPRVIAAVLENATVGLDHVRLIAFHHRTSTGLEIVARRQDWLRDLLVERRLLRNPMIGEIVLGRVMSPKRLFPTYKIAIDRDVPELSRIKVRGMLRKKWSTATSEERADLLFRTEARCLQIMTGCTFDAKTTAILCGRPINSVMFVQSIAKFPSSPPALLAHLFKQPFVRKSPPLKKMLLSHPNMPGDVKRSI